MVCDYLYSSFQSKPAFLKNNSPGLQTYLELHLAVFLYGFTAILGDLIQLSALHIVWWRVLISSLVLIFFVRFFNLAKDLGWRKIGQLSFVGVLIALHWLTFYGSIKLSNASIALVCFGTTPFFTALFEPMVFKARFKWLDICIGLIVIPAMIMVVFTLDLSMRLGIYVGILSAALSALFTSFSKKYMDDIDPFRVSFIELGSAFLFLCPMLFLFGNDASFLPSSMDWIYLIILAVFCTCLAFYLSVRSLKKLSAFNVNLAINLEPIYGIILAIFILKEHKELSPQFYVGAVVIIIAVFSYPMIKKYVSK